VLKHNLEKLFDQNLGIDLNIVVLASKCCNDDGGDVMGVKGLCREFGIQLVEMENDGWLDFGKWKRFMESPLFKKNKYDRLVLMNGILPENLIIDRSILVKVPSRRLFKSMKKLFKVHIMVH
jgi:hypothetical protein